MVILFHKGNTCDRAFFAFITSFWDANNIVVSILPNIKELIITGFKVRWALILALCHTRFSIILLVSIEHWSNHVKQRIVGKPAAIFDILNGILYDRRYGRHILAIVRIMRCILAPPAEPVREVSSIAFTLQAVT